MKPKHIFVETWQLIVFLHFTNTKVLSQNLANLRSLGYMPDQVALELKQMQNGYSAPKYQKNYEVYAKPFTYAESEAIKLINSRAKEKKILRYTGKKDEVETEVETDNDAKKRFVVKDVVVDFDELVNKVKDKLKDEFYEKKRSIDSQKAAIESKKKLRNNPDMENSKKDESLSLKQAYEYDDNKKTANEPREAWKHFMTTKSPNNILVTPDLSHVSQSKKKKKRQTNDKIFEVADLTKTKDSYEDYITPKRGNIYASDTETETKNPIPKNEGKLKERYSENEEPQEQYKKLPKAADMLKTGKTSDRMSKIKKLDDPISVAQEEYESSETTTFVENVEKAIFVKLGSDSDEEPVKSKGTMIPKREFYTMSTPNYFAKLPAVAEKYDFNEPLPDKDREPEKLKYFFNPPARINKKVKLQAVSEVVEEIK